MFWSFFLRCTDNAEIEDASTASADVKLPPEPSASSKVHISGITASSVFAEMSQIWQVIIYNGCCRAEDRVLAQSPSITSLCVCASFYGTDKQEDVGFSAVPVHGVHLISAWQAVMNSLQTRHWQVS